MPTQAAEGLGVSSRLTRIVNDQAELRLRASELFMESDEGYKFVMELELEELPKPASNDPELAQLRKAFQMLSRSELDQNFRADWNTLAAKASQTLQCVGCRRAVESLLQGLSTSSPATLYPFMVDKNRTVSYALSARPTAESCFPMLRWTRSLAPNYSERGAGRNGRAKRCALHSLDSQKLFTAGSWLDVWLQLSPECQDELMMIKSELFLETLKAYLTKHRFCNECKDKVLLTYDILIGQDDIDEDDAEFNPELFQGLTCCETGCHINISRDTGFIAHLIGKAREDLVSGERHATTLEQAQKEVLICLGNMLWDRLQQLWLRIRGHEQACQQVFHLASTLMWQSLRSAVEAKDGFAAITALVEQIGGEERDGRKKKGKNKKKKGKGSKDAAEEAAAATTPLSAPPEEADQGDVDEDEQGDSDDDYSAPMPDPLVLHVGRAVSSGASGGNSSNGGGKKKSKGSSSQQQQSQQAAKKEDNLQPVSAAPAAVLSSAAVPPQRTAALMTAPPVAGSARAHAHRAVPAASSGRAPAPPAASTTAGHVPLIKQKPPRPATIGKAAAPISRPAVLPELTQRPPPGAIQRPPPEPIQRPPLPEPIQRPPASFFTVPPVTTTTQSSGAKPNVDAQQALLQMLKGGASKPAAVPAPAHSHTNGHNKAVGSGRPAPAGRLGRELSEEMRLLRDMGWSSMFTSGLDDDADNDDVDDGRGGDTRAPQLEMDPAALQRLKAQREALRSRMRQQFDDFVAAGASEP